MRVSVRKNDPGYNRLVSLHCKVFVNEVEVTTRCYTADEEEGIALCYKHNDEGQKFFDSTTGKAAQETLRGKVEIVVNAYNGAAL